MIRRLIGLIRHPATGTLPLDGDGSARYLPWLIAVMAYLAALGVIALMVMNAALYRWDSGLRGSLTVQVPPPVATGFVPQAQMDAMLKRLREEGGIQRADAIDPATALRLVAPWLGPGIDSSVLPMPILIDVHLVPDAPVPDLAHLGRELAALIPGTTIDRHGEWLDRLLSFGRLAQAGAILIVGLILLATILAVIFASRTGLLLHAGLIDLLHLMGATDGYIAAQFEAHAFRVGLLGGIYGVLPAIMSLGALRLMAEQGVLSVMPGGGGLGGAIPPLTVPIVSWVLIAALPLVLGLIARLAARRTVLSVLAQKP